MDIWNLKSYETTPLLFSLDSGQTAEDFVAGIATSLILEKKIEASVYNSFGCTTNKCNQRHSPSSCLYFHGFMLIFLYVTYTERERKSKRSCVMEASIDWKLAWAFLKAHLYFTYLWLAFGSFVLVVVLVLNFYLFIEGFQQRTKTLSKLSHVWALPGILQVMRN